MEKEVTKSARLNGDIMKQIKKFTAENGGSIKAVLEMGSLWVMSAGAKEYLKKIRK